MRLLFTSLVALSLGGCAIPFGTAGSLGAGKWQKLETATSDQLNAIDFADARTGLIVSNKGTVYRTFDGALWAGLKPPGLENKDLLDVSFGGPAAAFLVTRTSIFRSLDAGGNWTVLANFQELFKEPGITGVRFTSATDGWVMGAANLYRTIDGGATWTVAFAEPGGGVTTLATTAAGVTIADSHGRLRRYVTNVGWIVTMDVAREGETDGCGGCAGTFTFPSATEGWYFTSREGLLHTTDAGASWTTFPAALSTGAALAAGSVGGGGAQMSLSFPAPTVGWLRTGSSFLTTADGGRTWEQFPNKDQAKALKVGPSDVLDVHTLSAQAGWAVGRNGLLLRFTR